MQSKTFRTFIFAFFQILLLGLGANLLFALSASASTQEPLNTKQILKSEHPENNPDVIALLKSQDDEDKFLFFQEAFEKQKLQLFEKPEQNLSKSYLLRDYARAWSLLSQARQEPENRSVQKQIERFIAQHNGQYLAERVRTDWLLIMAPVWHRNNQWKTFSAVRNQLQWNKSAPGLVCWDIYHRISNANTISQKQADEILDTINSPSFKGNGICRRVSNVLINKKPSTAFTRLIVLTQQNRLSEARDVLNFLIKKDRLPAKEARLAFNSPSRWYRNHRNKLSSQNKFVRLIAAYRLTSVNTTWAVRVADSVNGSLSKTEKSALWGRLGYVAAIYQNSDALKWFAKGGTSVCTGPYSAFPEECLQWRARAALREKDWRNLNRFIAALPASTAKNENWTYWKARALSELGQKEQAAQYFRSIPSVRTFYGKLAAEALGNSFYYSSNETVEATKEAVASAGKNASLKRAKAFYDLGLFVEGHREWQWGIRNMSPSEKLAAAQWAQSESLLHRSINTGIRVAEDYPLEHDLLYPRPFEKEINSYAKKADIDVNWVYGLMRQESRFIAAARSRVGANGLMQIMPATAKWIAKQLELADFKPQTIYEIDTNIYFGTTYLRTLLDRLDGNIILATAGYNAGPNRASRWQATLPKTTEGAIFIETIPFTETRNYVQNVLANTVEYAHGQGQSIPSFKNWLGNIRPEAKEVVKETI